MKRIYLLLILLVIILVLPGCSRYPEQADDGNTWDKNWEMLGTSLGVEEPGNGFSLLENNVVLAANDTYYASWISGEPSVYVNSEGKEVDLYPAQIYLLYYGCKDSSSAQEAMKEWMNREKESYQIREEQETRLNGQDYKVMTYDCGSETNPYSRGAAAFGIFHHYVVSAEISCTELFTRDESVILTDFLKGCHFSSAAVK